MRESHIRDKNKFKNRLFISFGSMFQDYFCYIIIQCFKTNICFIWFNVSRLFISRTHKKLFAFPFTLFTSTPLYTYVHSLSYHPISNTLDKKQCHLLSTFQ